MVMTLTDRCGVSSDLADDLYYLLTQIRLRILDALAGPEPETAADQQRRRDRERITRAFPKR